jgi:hypothetical protein
MISVEIMWRRQLGWDMSPILRLGSCSSEVFTLTVHLRVLTDSAGCFKGQLVSSSSLIDAEAVSFQTRITRETHSPAFLPKLESSTPIEYTYLWS